PATVSAPSTSIEATVLATAPTSHLSRIRSPRSKEPAAELCPSRSLSLVIRREDRPPREDAYTARGADFRFVIGRHSGHRGVNPLPYPPRPERQRAQGQDAVP